MEPEHRHRVKGLRAVTALRFFLVSCGGGAAACGTPPTPAPSVTPAGIPSAEWTAGSASASLPDRALLRPLPGGGSGGPVVTSNNPETFTGDGLLYGTARPSASRGGEAYPLTGDFGVYLHHLNRSGAPRWVAILATSAGDAPVTISGQGSGYTQTETGGLGLGTSPDYRVSAEWILGTPGSVIPATTLAPGATAVVWRKNVANGAEIDGRFSLRSNGPLFVAIVASGGNSVQEIAEAALGDAPGTLAIPGNPPPPYGREAGVYAHDTWLGTIEAQVPRPGRFLGFWVNTATGTGAPQVQAFPALTRFSDSSRESVGMYGNVYDLTLRLVHDGDGRDTRRVRVLFAAYVSGPVSRYWDGLGLVNGVDMVVRLTPQARTTTLAELAIPSGETRSVTLRMMVPGLTSIPEALFVESY